MQGEDDVAQVLPGDPLAYFGEERCPLSLHFFSIELFVADEVGEDLGRLTVEREVDDLVAAADTQMKLLLHDSLQGCD